LEYHVRTARLTDVDGALRLLHQDAAPDEEARRDDAERLHSLLSIPPAPVAVSESGRRVIGLGVLSIRPSLRSGTFVAVVDELAVGSPTELSGAAGANEPKLRRGVLCSILEHLVTSAHNKGCSRVEVSDPLASAEPSLLKQAGFARRGKLLSRAFG
jgi:hypothetical protein